MIFETALLSLPLPILIGGGNYGVQKDRNRPKNYLRINSKLHDVHANQIIDWKNQLLDPAAGVFGSESSIASPVVELNELHAKIGKQALENDFLPAALSQQNRHAERKGMNNRDHALPNTRQLAAAADQRYSQADVSDRRQ